MKFISERISVVSRISFLILLTVFCADSGWSAFYQTNEQPRALATRSHILWRFQMAGPYSLARPAIAPDGTVYVADVYGNLYALAPDGTLKWQQQAGNKGVAIGADGTIYTASENDILAFEPSGALKWRYVLNPRAMITIGISVGPDGNIYSVATESIGVFSLTPQGALRWSTPETYKRPPVDYGEIVFGRNGNEGQLYFYANAHIRALRMSDGPMRSRAPRQISLMASRPSARWIIQYTQMSRPIHHRGIPGGWSLISTRARAAFRPSMSVLMVLVMSYIRRGDFMQ